MRGDLNVKEKQTFPLLTMQQKMLTTEDIWLHFAEKTIVLYNVLYTFSLLFVLSFATAALTRSILRVMYAILNYYSTNKSIRFFRNEQNKRKIKRIEKGGGSY